MSTDFSLYIRRLIETKVHSSLGSIAINGDSLSTLNNLSKILIRKLTVLADKLLTRSDKKLLTHNEVKIISRILTEYVPPSKSLTKEVKLSKKYPAMKVISIYDQIQSLYITATEGYDNREKGVKSRISTTSGLTIPTSRVNTIVQRLVTDEHKVTKRSIIYITVVVEIIIGSIIETVLFNRYKGELPTDTKNPRKRITVGEIRKAIFYDDILRRVFKDTY